MKKTLFFLPAIIFAVFILWVSIRLGTGTVDWGETIPITVAFIAAGFLLCKNIFWGGLVGMLPAIYLISFGDQTYTGLELPIGIVLFVYYAICSFIVYKKKSANN